MVLNDTCNNIRIYVLYENHQTVSRIIWPSSIYKVQFSSAIFPLYFPSPRWCPRRQRSLHHLSSHAFWEIFSGSTRPQPRVGLRLGQRRRRWPNIKPARDWPLGFSSTRTQLTTWPYSGTTCCTLGCHRGWRAISEGVDLIISLSAAACVASRIDPDRIDSINGVEPVIAQRN